MFLPFLLCYIIIILLFHTHELKFHGDQSRYLQFAHNILNGYYSPAYPNIDLTNGPGYPLILAPFLLVGASITVLILMNGFFYYLSIVYLYKSLTEFASFKVSLLLSLFWGLYYNAYQELVQLMTEVFTCFLLTLIIYALIKVFKHPERRLIYIIFSGILIGYLALTKIIFGYVLICLLLGSLIIWGIGRSSNLKKIVLILATGFLFTTPYLLYTYHLTGKVLFWGTPGNDSLYWMSTPFENEYGNWYGEFDIQDSQKQINNFPGYLDSLKLHHQKDYEQIFSYKDIIKREEIYKKIAINNIKANPLKYLENCFSNIGRLLFSFPYSYSIESNKTLLRLPLNGCLVLLSLFCLIPTFCNWKTIFFPIKFFMFFIALYLGASILVSTQIRMFTIVVPILIFWIGFILQKSVKIKFRFNEKGI